MIANKAIIGVMVCLVPLIWCIIHKVDERLKDTAHVRSLLKLNIRMPC